jgi:hypothetical protein
MLGHPPARLNGPLDGRHLAGSSRRHPGAAAAVAAGPTPAVKLAR